jgi:hypothetical protein
METDHWARFPGAGEHPLRSGDWWQATYGASPTAPRRLGLLAGEFSVPDDFNEMGATEIESLFGLSK